MNSDADSAGEQRSAVGRGCCRCRLTAAKTLHFSISAPSADAFPCLASGQRYKYSYIFHTSEVGARGSGGRWKKQPREYRRNEARRLIGREKIIKKWWKNKKPGKSLREREEKKTRAWLLRRRPAGGWRMEKG